jgi:hypothetical protein
VNNCVVSLNEFFEKLLISNIPSDEVDIGIVLRNEFPVVGCGIPTLVGSFECVDTAQIIERGDLGTLLGVVFDRVAADNPRPRR